MIKCCRLIRFYRWLFHGKTHSNIRPHKLSQSHTLTWGPLACPTPPFSIRVCVLMCARVCVCDSFSLSLNCLMRYLTGAIFKTHSHTRLLARGGVALRHILRVQCCLCVCVCWRSPTSLLVRLPSSSSSSTPFVTWRTVDDELSKWATLHAVCVWVCVFWIYEV